MSTAAAGTVARGNETRVCPSPEAALEVVGVKAKAKIKKEAAEDAARVLRATFRLVVPIEPVAIAQELGVRVLEADIDQDKLGGLLMRPGEEPKIYMNRDDGLIRRRLTCALELGHYVRHSVRTNLFGRVDRRSDRSNSAEDPKLVYAEEFAACLLVPDLEVRVMAELGIDDLEMALRCQVPREVVQLRLNDLGLRTVDLRAA